MIDILYSESNAKIEFNLTSSGNKFNPFEISDDSDDENNIHLGVNMLKKISDGKINYEYSDELNKIKIMLEK